MVRFTATEPVAASTRRGDPVGCHPTPPTPSGRPATPVPASASKILKGNIDWTFGGSGYRYVWCTRTTPLFFGAAKESDENDAGVQSIGTTCSRPGDYFELIARQTSGATKDVAADELAWFAIEVVE